MEEQKQPKAEKVAIEVNDASGVKIVKDAKDAKEVRKAIRDLAKKYSDELKKQIDLRVEEMKEDDNSHYLIYQVLGIAEEEGALIDGYQNKGRFLYKYAGAFLESVATLCFQYSHPEGKKTKIDNPVKGGKPKTFEIDYLVGNDAIEIKWKDATTDGDHITKEHTRVKAISDKGLKPIRVMFYYPQRKQAKRVQETLRTLYKGVEGEYYAGDDAWEYVKNYTKIDLKEILTEIAEENKKEK